VLIFFTVFGLLYAGFGAQSPFLPALLNERGLVPEEVGLVLASSTAIRVLAGPLLGHVADYLRKHALILFCCALAAATSGFGYLSTDKVWALLLVGVAQAAALAPIVPISDALATSIAYLHAGPGKRFEYGWARATGSAAFILGTVFAGGAIQHAGIDAIVWLGGASLILAGIAALRLPALPRPPSRSTTRARIGAADLRLLLRIKPFRRLLLVAALVEGSHALHDGFAVIWWQENGITAPTISLLWSESVAAEVVVFLLVGRRMIDWLTPVWTSAVAAIAGTLRWTSMALITSPILLAFVQPLHGLTFALLHLGAMRLIVQTVPTHLAATAQALYGTFCIGLVTAVLTLASGVLYGNLRGGSFLVMAALCIIALPLCPGLRLSTA
jgi:PPP family 3-phenylpropionic acid transporter